MERSSVKSTVVKEVGYDKAKELLEVVFQSGDIHQYEKVPHNIFISFMRAPSMGNFYFEYIKHNYEYTPIHNNKI